MTLISEVRLGIIAIALFSPETITALLEKHPQPTEYLPDYNICSDDSTTASVSTTITSFSPNSSNGFDGLRAQHLKDCLKETEDSRKNLLSDASSYFLQTLTKILNLIIKGEVPLQVRKYFLEQSS